MPQATGNPTPDGHYEFDVSVGGRKKRLIWDPGFSNPDCEVGIFIDPDNYDRLKKDGKVGDEQMAPVDTGTGPQFSLPSGVIEVQLLDDDGKPLGPKLKVRVVRNPGPRNPRVLGMCFLKRLKGLTLVWKLGGEDPPVIKKTE